MHDWVELSSRGIQNLAAAIIVVSIIFGSVRFLRQLATRATDPYRAYKELLGRSLLLALELMVAADVIRTVLVDLTAKGLETLAALVLIRTFLSWSLVVELEGRWPWRSAVVAAQSEREEDSRKLVYASAGGLDTPAQWANEVSVASATPGNTCIQSGGGQSEDQSPERKVRSL